MIRSLLPLALALLGTPALAQPPAADWPTWGYDPERTAWNRGETTLSKANVGRLAIAWSTQLPTPMRDVVLSTLTAPIVIGGVATAQGPKNVLVVLGSDDTLYALDADSGRPLWSKTFPNPVKATKIATWLCSSTANATPTADTARGIVYFMASDGKLRGLALADGAEKLAPVEAVAPFTRAWSLNLIDGVVYTTSGRACGELTDPRSAMYAARALTTPFDPAHRPTDPSAVTAVDVRDLQHPSVTRFYTSGSRPGAPWGRGGLARGPNDSVILETSDGVYDPQSGNWGDSILRLAGKATRILDSFTPPNYRYLLQHDLAGSASPVVFEFGGKTLVAVAQKESVLRLLDANDLGGGPLASHQTPLWQSPVLGNEIAAGTDPSQGVWGGITTYLTPGGRRFLYVPMWGPLAKTAPAFPVTGGPTPHGGIMAFEVVSAGGKVTAEPRWMSGDMIMADPPVVANGIVYATSTGGQANQNPMGPDGKRVANTTEFSIRNRSTPVDNLKLLAFDAETGRQLYSSKALIKDWVHFGEPVVALGKVFLVTHDAHVYALSPAKK